MRSKVGGVVGCIWPQFAAFQARSDPFDLLRLEHEVESPVAAATTAGSPPESDADELGDRLAARHGELDSHPHAESPGLPELLRADPRQGELDLHGSGLHRPR